jgi:hypothetical protein
MTTFFSKSRSLFLSGHENRHELYCARRGRYNSEVRSGSDAVGSVRHMFGAQRVGGSTGPH